MADDPKKLLEILSARVRQLMFLWLIDEANAKGGASVEEREIFQQWAIEDGLDYDPNKVKNQLLLETNIPPGYTQDRNGR